MQVLEPNSQQKRRRTYFGGRQKKRQHRGGDGERGKRKEKNLRTTTVCEDTKKEISIADSDGGGKTEQLDVVNQRTA